ncbi:methionine ABC transporter ATP-binding protein [Citrobacter rodentium]|jgi:ABC-type metal ion transport system, ATPase component|uniref:Cell division ATP-binding protein FtsE n=2 Tax=Citrobacter rodentium TaxID=67825 RepID=D2TGX5_CITRI|nr:ATP-binding cassette domain-containing protein [Citrobacter rodentium]KIQ52790.1 methionine ABC transporter ATP-binding protein [Citrobacter rodentium]QBY27975.1 ATP-binding cassette domain-containing protein [Citrobacter rodentium]UHO30143.1 ATP-binding cassette domain-containing protein [Citrobacter rodentium NBRC 105723 = DSM 16636]CBG88139.1 putative ABC transporter ATP-binding protein [Citrobacter rodentium ICC168]HAT8012487.1 methionine ABC transporter ATP-binding protein [Citrobacter
MIVLKNISKVFTPGRLSITAVDNVNLTVEQGQIYGIIGYSGAGKSTLIRLLNGLEKPTAGSVTINGQQISTASGEALRQARLKISMVFQHFNLLWSRTVSENIAFSMQIAGAPKAAIKARVAELIALVGLTGRENAYPSQLSGGQKQRVGIARALANSPDVLLCDEATSALDPQTTDQILDLLLDINRRFALTIVLITHEMHVVRKICDRVAVMENGKVVEEGEVLQVFTHPQQPITRQFVSQVGQYADEEAFNPQLVSELGGTVIRLTFTGHSTHQPIVGELTLRYGLPFNILHGKMNQTAHGVFGQLWLHVAASEEQLNNILADLQKSGIETEVIQHG